MKYGMYFCFALFWLLSIQSPLILNSVTEHALPDSLQSNTAKVHKPWFIFKHRKNMCVSLEGRKSSGLNIFSLILRSLEVGLLQYRIRIDNFAACCLNSTKIVWNSTCGRSFTLSSCSTVCLGLGTVP